MDFTKIKTIAVVGISDKPDRPSFQVASYLMQQGYEIIPVNPALKEVLGRPAYASVLDIPREISLDVVDIFRKPDAVPQLVEEAIERGARVIWLQEGIIHEEAAARAREAGLEVVMDKCIKKEHAKIVGGKK